MQAHRFPTQLEAVAFLLSRHSEQPVGYWATVPNPVPVVITPEGDYSVEFGLVVDEAPAGAFSVITDEKSKVLYALAYPKVA